MKSLAGNPDPDAAFFRHNLSAFLSRLAWHCHFIQKLEQQPDIEFKCMHPAFEGMREPHFREDFFEAWKTGHTGYPLVDACMRSLHENGWITFRMRAMLVSFASYHLWLDWRKTAPFLAQLFTDYEPGIHYSQFQMQSGGRALMPCGCITPSSNHSTMTRRESSSAAMSLNLKVFPTALSMNLGACTHHPLVILRLLWSMRPL